MPYRYQPAADAHQVADLIGRMATGTVDVLVITSSPQVDRLFEVAAERDLTDVLRAGLKRTKVAAVGPVRTVDRISDHALHCFVALIEKVREIG